APCRGAQPRPRSGPARPRRGPRPARPRRTGGQTEPSTAMSDPVIIKICGLKTAALVGAAIEAGADMVGFVHFPRSPRHIDLDAIGELISLARGRVESCVLLVNPDNTLVAQVAAL